MPSFQILSANEKKRFTGSKGGEFIVWNVEFDGNDGRGTAEMVKQATSPKPEGAVDATLEPTQYGWKLKENRKNGFGGGGFKGKSPQERAEIRRMNAQGHALRLLAAQVAAGKAPPEGTTIFGHLKPLIDWFETDTKQAGEQA